MYDLALVFSVKKLKSILVKELAACKKRMVDFGYIPCITQIYQFSWLRQKKSIKSTLTTSIWQTHKDHYKNFFYQVTELMTDFPMQDSKSTSKQFFVQTVFYFFWTLYCLSATGSSAFKRDRNNENLFR